MSELLTALQSFAHHYGGYHNDYGYNHGGYGYHGYHDCCPGVVNPLTYIALLSYLALAVYLLREQIFKSNLMMAKRRKKRQIPELILKGKCDPELPESLREFPIINLVSFCA